MKNIIIIVLIILLLLFGWLWYDSKSQLQALKTSAGTEEVKETSESTEAASETMSEVAETSDEAVASDTIYIEKIVTPVRKYTKEELEVQSMIKDVHADWEKVFAEDDPQALLNDFTPAFTTNEAIIDTDNFAHVDRHNNTDFKEHLEALAATPYTIKFGKPEFLYTYVKDVVFTSSYRTDFTLYDEGGNVLQKSNIITYISGEKIGGEWKIGNYNWIKYDKFDKTK